jgi:hypothetical protein
LGIVSCDCGNCKGQKRDGNACVKCDEIGIVVVVVVTDSFQCRGEEVALALIYHDQTRLKGNEEVKELERRVES